MESTRSTVAALILALALISISGALLRFSCGWYNYWFVDLPAQAQGESASAQETGESKTEQQNPFASPRQTVQPKTAKLEPPVVVPSVRVSLVLGCVLVGLQLAVSGAVLVVLEPAITAYGGMVFSLGTAIAFVVTFVATAGFVSALLSNGFKRGLIVTTIYYVAVAIMGWPILSVCLFSVE